MTYHDYLSIVRIAATVAAHVFQAKGCGTLARLARGIEWLTAAAAAPHDPAIALELLCSEGVARWRKVKGYRATP